MDAVSKSSAVSVSGPEGMCLGAASAIVSLPSADCSFGDALEVGKGDNKAVKGKKKEQSDRGLDPRRRTQSDWVFRDRKRKRDAEIGWKERP